MTRANEDGCSLLSIGFTVIRLDMKQNGTHSTCLVFLFPMASMKIVIYTEIAYAL